MGLGLTAFVFLKPVFLLCPPQIAERTGIWPMLQTLWVCGESQEGDDGLIQITDDHRAMTLNALRVRPGDTIYFRAAVSTLALSRFCEPDVTGITGGCLVSR